MENSQSNRKAQGVEHNFQRGNLLVVEDAADHWLLIRRGLQAYMPGVNLVWMATAPEAIHYLQTCAARQISLPRLVLLDLYLPSREDGFALLRGIKASTSLLRGVPVVILSTSDNQDDIGQAYESGASSYFTKPAQSAEWAPYFQTIFEYWGRIATLPNGRLI